jgi:type IV pilus assembly protein PilA
MAVEVGPRARSQAGFTLVEILVVMLILALLAAIAIPAFFSQRDKARDAEAKVQVRTAQAAIETYSTDHDGSYAGATTTALEQIEPSLRDVPTGKLTVQPMGASGKYRVAVESGTGNEFTIRRETDDSASYPCTSRGTGGCPATGFWG